MDFNFSVGEVVQILATVGAIMWNNMRTKALTAAQQTVLTAELQALNKKFDAQNGRVGKLEEYNTHHLEQCH